MLTCFGMECCLFRPVSAWSAEVTLCVCAAPQAADTVHWCASGVPDRAPDLCLLPVAAPHTHTDWDSLEPLAAPSLKARVPTHGPTGHKKRVREDQRMVAAVLSQVGLLCVDRRLGVGVAACGCMGACRVGCSWQRCMQEWQSREAQSGAHLVAVDSVLRRCACWRRVIFQREPSTVGAVLHSGF
jgi:hypothetical protein